MTVLWHNETQISTTRDKKDEKKVNPDQATTGSGRQGQSDNQAVVETRQVSEKA
jgi:hypothetical protein